MEDIEANEGAKVIAHRWPRSRQVILAKADPAFWPLKR